MPSEFFTAVNSATPTAPILLSVPHAGRSYDPALLAQLRVSAAAVLPLEDRYADRLIELATGTGIAAIVAHAPRLLIDLNRAPDDIDPRSVGSGAHRGPPCSAKARAGLGVIPTRLWGVGPLWRNRLDPSDIAARLHDVHAPYHAAIAHALMTMRRRWGVALLIDLHSMPPLKGTGQASFVIGDRFGGSAASELTAMAQSVLEGLGFPVATNTPYAGGYIVTRHSRPADGVHALQIEVDRSLYLDTGLVESGPGLPRMQKAIVRLVACLGDELTGAFAQAAE